MAGRSYDLNKTWIPGQSRGTTVFNSSGNIAIPYGRNKITVSGSASPGNPSTPSTPATYNGPSPATYNPTSGGNVATYSPPATATYNPRNTATYNAAGNPAALTYNPVGCAQYNSPTGGNSAAPYTPGNCTQPTYGNCVSPSYYNSPSGPVCSGVYNQPSGGNCTQFSTTCQYQSSVCNQYQPYGGNYAGCASPNPAVPSYCNQFAGGNTTCNQYSPTCSGYNPPGAGNFAGYNPATEVSWTAIAYGPGYGGAAYILDSGTSPTCPGAFYLDYYFGTDYVYYTCSPVGNNAYYNPPSPGTCIPGPPDCTGGYYYQPVYCAGNYNAYVPVGCDPQNILYNPVSQGPCVQYSPGPCVNYNTPTCTQTSPYVAGNCITNPGPAGNCTYFNPNGCAASNPAYNNTYNTVYPGNCSQPTGGTGQTYQPGAPSNPQTYNAGNPLTYNPPTSATYNTLVPGNTATYYPGGAPATYNPFVPGNPGTSTNVLGVYFPGGVADGLAAYVSGVSNYWNYPDGATYPVTVTPQGQITVKIE